MASPAVSLNGITEAPPAGRPARPRRGVLAQLQRADVGDDGPAIFGPDLRRVIGHGAETVRHHVEEVPDRREPQPIDVQRRRRPIAAAHDHAVAGAGPPVARRTIDVVPLPAARHDVLVHGETETPSHPRRRPCPCKAACPRAAGRARLCRPPGRGPNDRRRKTSIRAAGCTSADRACPAGSAQPQQPDDNDQPQNQSR